MVRAEVWGDFVFVEERVQQAKQGVARTETFLIFKCPHCLGDVEVLKSERNTKAVACAKHFWRKRSPCEKRPETDVRGRPSTLCLTEPISTQTAPVVGQPVVQESAKDHAERLLAESRLEWERRLNEKQQALVELQKALTIEQLRSERRKRERAENARETGLDSDHTSDSESTKQKKRKERQVTAHLRRKSSASATKSAATPTAEPKRARKSIHEHAAQAARTGMPSHSQRERASSSSAKASATSAEQYGRDVTTVMRASKFAHKMQLTSVHPDKLSRESEEVKAAGARAQAYIDSLAGDAQ